MAGIEMLSMNRSISRSKTNSPGAAQRDNEVRGFGDLLKEKESVKNPVKNLVGNQELSSEKTETGQTDPEQTEGSSKQEEDIAGAGAQLHMLLAAAFMNLPPTVAVQPILQQDGEAGDAVTLLMPEGTGETESGSMPIHMPIMAQEQVQVQTEQAVELPGTALPEETEDTAVWPESIPGEPVDMKETITGQTGVGEVDAGQPEEGQSEAETAHTEQTVYINRTNRQDEAGTQTELPEIEALPHEQNTSQTGEMTSGTENSAYHAGTGMIQNQPVKPQETPLLHQPQTQTMQTSPDTLPGDLAQMLGTRLPSSDGTLIIELEPEALGKLTIEVIYNQGKAAVSILSSNPKTLELLSHSLSDIAYILEEKTGQETVIYTPQAQPQSFFDEPQDRDRQEKQDNREEKKEKPSDTFAQQLRLGLI